MSVSEMNREEVTMGPDPLGHKSSEHLCLTMAFLLLATYSVLAVLELRPLLPSGNNSSQMRWDTVAPWALSFIWVSDRNPVSLSRLWYHSKCTKTKTWKKHALGMCYSWLLICAKSLVNSYTHFYQLDLKNCILEFLLAFSTIGLSDSLSSTWFCYLDFLFWSFILSQVFLCSYLHWVYILQC